MKVITASTRQFAQPKAQVYEGTPYPPLDMTQEILNAFHKPNGKRTWVASASQLVATYFTMWSSVSLRAARQWRACRTHIGFPFASDDLKWTHKAIRQFHEVTQHSLTVRAPILWHGAFASPSNGRPPQIEEPDYPLFFCPVFHSRVVCNSWLTPPTPLPP